MCIKNVPGNGNHPIKIAVAVLYIQRRVFIKLVMNAKEWLPLTARHRLNNVLMYEVEDSWKLGLEAYYFSKQRLTDGTSGRAYWITGFMVEKILNKVSLYINFENFSDTRQTRFESIYTGSISNPVFRDIYAPLDGFVINGGLKLKL